LSVLIAGMGPVFAGENGSPVYGESRYGEPIHPGFVPHSDAAKTGVTMPRSAGMSQRLETDPAEWADHHTGEGGKSAEYWQAAGTGSLPGTDKRSALPDFDKDPRWKESGGE